MRPADGSLATGGAGGGGGSSYVIPTATDVSMQAGAHSGDGQVVIAW